ncbi:YfhO family protein [Lacticaseibacillus baoqingensis]|uniref:YfhO family protein n=1 Tax=Lacticaseibacillus baoqingensis TaxID=2486013 RepID=A0ABW4E6Y8_9LACO|nr:YfhO family protein [Lacticaseibacillus baoqingensis]
MRIYRPLSHHALAAAFFLPILVMGIYFIGRGVYPFGNSSLLTVDMGQQYIDFYSYFRQTVLGHPGQLFYAFNKDLGGDMYGVFAYYLFSPFNLIVCLFPKSLLDVAIVVITLAKYACASLAMAYYLKQHGWQGLWLPGWGLTYALSGWMLANQLNLMWFDAVICLPLIAAGLDRLSTHRQPTMFITWLTVSMITNYYMAYMTCLFVCGYWGYVLCRDQHHWRSAWQVSWRFVYASLLAAGSAAVVLLPTLFQLTRSKGTYTVTKLHWRFEYSPVKIIGKFFTGAFNFDQMPNGQPNLFVGSLAMIGVILFFLLAKIPWRERLFAGFWTIFLTLSMMVEPLDLLWHGLQFPVWYPYRFSYVVCFWLLVLATRALLLLPEGINWWQMFIALGLIVACGSYVWLHLKSFSYLSNGQILTTCLFAFFALVLLSIRSDAHRFTPLLFMVLLIAESASNAVLTLNQLSYVSHFDYHTYTEALRTGVNQIQAQHTGTYRIGKTVLRTKNDAMQVDYLGTDQFNSMFEPSVPKLFGQLGQAAGDGFVAYTNGTEITDAFLDLKYWLDPKLTTKRHVFLPQVSARPDLQRYGQSGETADFNVYTNPYALGLGFAADQAILKTNFIDGMPVVNQELLLCGLTGDDFQTLFAKESLTPPTLKEARWNGAVVKKKGSGLATVTYTFTANTTDPYYLQIPATFTDNVVSLTQNGRNVPIYDTFRDPLLLNVTPTSPHEKQTLTFTLLKDSADFGQLLLYRLNQAAVSAKLTQLKQSPLHIKERTDRSLTGSISIEAPHQVLMTSIPNVAGWTVSVDGHPVKPKTALGLFMALPLKRGQHTLSMRYTPPFLWWGLLITLISICLRLLWWVLTPTGRHSRRHA